MIAAVQRVRDARVDVDGETVGKIDSGILILLGIHREDTESELEWVCRKCANLRIFPDGDGVMNLSLKDVGAEALVVSQFTLYGRVGKGNRPSYNHAAGPETAQPLFERFVSALADEIGRPVPTGIFGAMMDVHLTNVGPVTIWIERPPKGEASDQ